MTVFESRMFLRASQEPADAGADMAALSSTAVEAAAKKFTLCMSSAESIHAGEAASAGLVARPVPFCVLWIGA